jgi:hypothetical protein
LAYTDGQFTQPVLSLDASSTGDKGTWLPLGMPTTLRRLALTVTTATTGAVGTLSLDLRPIAGSNAGRVAAGAGTLTIPTGLAAGQVLYKALTLTVKPGQEVVFNVTAAMTAGIMDARLVIEPLPEIPANIPAMVASA